MTQTTYYKYNKTKQFYCIKCKSFIKLKIKSIDYNGLKRFGFVECPKCGIKIQKEIPKYYEMIDVYHIYIDHIYEKYPELIPKYDIIRETKEMQETIKKIMEMYGGY